MTKSALSPIDDSELIINRIQVKDLMFFMSMNCNLRCKTCYLGNKWLNGGLSFTKPQITSILTHFGQKGLDRLTFLGGEPFLVPNITEYVILANTLNIKERRLTTNALDLGSFDLHQLKGNELSHITVSFNGITTVKHEFISGKNTFKKTLSNVEKLINHGFRVHVNFTVTGINKDQAIDSVHFFKNIGASEINFHLVSMIGNAKKYPELNVTPEEWINVRNQLENIDNVKNISLRIPYMFVTKKEYRDMVGEKKYYPIQAKSYHSKTGQRIVLYPNGKVYISCDLTGTDFNFARYENEKFFVLKNTNELSLYKQKKSNPDISSYLLHLDNQGFVRLSISFKEKIIL